MKRLTTAFIFSASIHACALVGLPAVNNAFQPPRHSPITEPVRKEKQWTRDEIQQRREKLVQNARNDLEHGRLKLGEFILNANLLDTLEDGEKPDFEKASNRYNDYSSSLGKNLTSISSIHEALSETLDDFDYYGIPGGRLSDALLERGGSCVQIAHLVTSLLYDSGHRDDIYVRAYSGHLAPILRTDNEDYDLTTGEPAHGGGVQFPATDLIEAYAQSHSIKAHKLRIQRIPGEEFDNQDKKSTDRLGKDSGFTYPETTDPFPGSAPLFARHAIKRLDDDQTPDWRPFLPPVWLTNRPPLRRDKVVPGFLSVYPIKQISEYELSELSRNIEKAKREIIRNNAPDSHLDKIVHGLNLAYMARLYEFAGNQLRLHGRYNLAVTAEKERQEYVSESLLIINSVPYDADLFVRATKSKKIIFGHSALAQLTVLGPEGQNILSKILKTRRPEDNNLQLTYVAWLCSERGSEPALLEFEKMSVFEQAQTSLYVLIVCTEDHQKNEHAFRDLSDDGSVLYRATKIWRSVHAKSKNLQELVSFACPVYDDTSPLGFSKIADLINQGVDQYDLNNEWKIVMPAIYGHEMIVNGTFDLSTEDGQNEGMQFVKEVNSWLYTVHSEDPHLKKLKKEVAYILSKNRFDSDTVADAYLVYQSD
ncbi:hypothetical protein KKF81_06355 [Candidatus Micrarchaeota archaeon]|nr:hypothetical protein [Candidatus Micrarchaeota archaeon]